MDYRSTGSPVLDVFQVGKIDKHDEWLGPKLQKAWEEDPALTLRLIWNKRSIHDGKGDRELFYQAFGWLLENHPRTAIVNLPQLVTPIGKRGSHVSHGYWKVLLNIVALAFHEQLGPRWGPAPFLTGSRWRYGYWEDRHRLSDLERKQWAQEKWENKAVRFHSMIEKGLAKPRVRALYVAVARLFAEQLVKDIQLAWRVESMPPGEEREATLRQISLAGKWAPTPGGSHDRVTNLATAIAQLIYHDPSFAHRPTLSLSRDIPTSAPDAHILRSFYQRWILAPLRRVLSCPEPHMAANRWSDINYRDVTSTAMRRNLPIFYRHDPDRVEKYLEISESGNKDEKDSMSGATLLPHQLVRKAAKYAYAAKHTPDPAEPDIKDYNKRVADKMLRGIEAQWRTTVERVRAAGVLDDCLAVCDTSQSMGSLWDPKNSAKPIFPALALALLAAEVARPPFAHTFIEISSSLAGLVRLAPGMSLAERVRAVSHGSWDVSRFQDVFLKSLLQPGVAKRVPRERMVKRLLVFSDMRFDAMNQATEGAWDRMLDVLPRAFAKAGYDIPEIVYWDLAAGTRTPPAKAKRAGVTFMHGSSPAMLRTFLGEPEDTVDPDEVDVDALRMTRVHRDPKFIMMRAASQKSYDGLVVVD
ncbi:hypothetical protein PsYK624_135550 [Phanerochaete sordida]|uniref:Uncharacterized protein n=1 Tax=Phanerochaete sordida TaxID=48140 RepID=A0A9P3GPY4_9APHY|nr:hypothetical protein PsYK624_135550 [Phanerochaete sordida]